MKWRNTSFPWFDDMLLILGETLASGKYSFHGGMSFELGAEEDLFTDLDDESRIDPELQTSATASATNTRSSSPRRRFSDSAAITSGWEGPSESQAQKRHRESATIQTQAPPEKKAKVSGVGVMDKISDGLQAMAEAVVKSSLEAIPKETVDSTIQGQAQEKMQEERCLTEEGQLVILEVLADANLARTFMAIKAEKLRTKWLKKQLEKHVTDNGSFLEELFIDWENTQYELGR